MTIFADYCFMFQIGLLFSLMTYDQIRKSGSIFRNKYFLFGIIYQTLFCMPLSIICYIVYPDWCWMYWVDASSVPLWAPILAFSIYYLFFTAGYAVGFLSEKKRRGKGMNILIISLIYLTIFSIVTYDRLYYVGTIEQYNSGTILSITSIPVWFLFVLFMIIGAFLVMVIILVRIGNRMDIPWGEEDQARLDKKKKVVSLMKVENDIKASIKSSLALWGGEKYIKELSEQRNNNVIIKPNFSGGGKDKAGTQTSAEVLSAVIEIIREISPNANIKVAESSSIFWTVTVLLKNSKYEKLFKEKGVEFLNLSKGTKRLHDFRGRIGEEVVSKFLEEPHFLIDVPVAKTHSFYTMSGAIKNLFGLLPDKHKLFRYHAKGFADTKGRIFIDIYRNYPPDLVILDGIVSGEGHGPYGVPKETNFIMTSDDAISTDIILAQIMGFQRKKIPYLNILYKEGLKCEVNILGETIDSIKPESWKHAKGYGFFINILKIWADNIKVRLTKENIRIFFLITIATLLFAFGIEAINAFVVKWWFYTHELTLIVIIIIWLLLGMILASLTLADKRNATGPAFAIYGLIVEILNLLYFQLWDFTGPLELIGTFIVWVLFGFLIWYAELLYSRSSKSSRK